MKLCNLRCAIASSFFLLCGLTGPEVSASVLFQNQSPGKQITGEMIPSRDSIQAENFSLTNASSIESLTLEVLTYDPEYRWWSSSEYLARPIDRNSLMVDWSIWTSAGDRPGGTSALFSGSIAPSLTALENNCPYCLHRLEVLLDVPNFNLAAGDYWVGFKTKNAGEGLFWTFTPNGDPLTATGYVSRSGTTDWYPNVPNYWNDFQPPKAHVFSVRGSAANVSDIPEPASLALFGIGLAGLLIPRRKKNF